VSYPANSGPHSLWFTVMNTGEVSDVYTLTCGSLGGVSCVSVQPTSLELEPYWEDAVRVTFNVGSGGGKLSLTATGGATDKGSYIVTIADPPAPLVDLTPHNADHQDMARCAESCFAATAAFSTVPYYTLDTPRNVTLAYHGDRVDPKPFVHADVKHGGDASNMPDAFRLQVKKAGGTFVTFLNGEQTLRFTASLSWVRLAGQFDAAANGMGATGVYAVTVIVGAEYSSTVTESRCTRRPMAPC
jgi:hypothetical protein